MAFLTITCPCLFGLESVLAGEIKRMGGQEVETTDGRVSFKGNAQMVARANIMLRTAERVLIVVGSFRAETFSELFDGVYALRLEDFIGSEDAFPVKGWALSSKLMSVPDCQSIIKKSVAKRLGQAYGR
ncbi:MAG: THUMP domain-containing protein, partial [Oscillospiraceae bacterium]